MIDYFIDELMALSRMCYQEGYKFRLNDNGTRFLDYPLAAEFQMNIIDTKCGQTKHILQSVRVRFCTNNKPI